MAVGQKQFEQFSVSLSYARRLSVTWGPKSNDPPPPSHIITISVLLSRTLRSYVLPQFFVKHQLDFQTTESRLFT